jgi:hypothetical protein
MTATGAHCLPGRGSRLRGSELVHADDHGGVALLRLGLAISGVVELEDPVPLGLEVRVVRLLPGLDHLKRNALLSEEQAQSFVADVVDHPLSHQELGQLGQARARKGQAVVDGPAESDLLDFPALGQGKGRGSAPGVLGHERVEPVVVEVVDHGPHPVR